MSTAFFVVGLVFLGVGLLLLVVEFFRRPQPAAQEALDLPKLLEEIRKTLEDVEQRFRVPLLVIFVGLALALIGVYLKVNDAKDAAEQVAAIATGLR